MENDKLKEQKYKILNERFREVEEEVFVKADRITKHLRQALNDGMKEYETFVLEGLIIIEPYGDDVSEDISMKFERLHKYCAIMTTDESDDSEFMEIWEHTRNYDWSYKIHPEAYPDDYSPITRAYEHIIMNSIARGELTEEDIIYVKPEHIMPHIIISI